MVNGMPKTDFIAVAEPGIGIVGLLLVRSHSDNVSNAFITCRCANIEFDNKGDTVGGREGDESLAAMLDGLIGTTPSIIDTISRSINRGTNVLAGFKK